jgi:hypothetical protein
MELALLVYGISVMSAITGLCLFLCAALVIFVTFQLLIYVHNKENFKYGNRKYEGSTEDLANWKATKSLVNKCVIIFIILSSIMVVLPSKQTAYVMVAAYAAQSVAQSAGASVLSEKVLKVIEKELDSQLAQIKK